MENHETSNEERGAEIFQQTSKSLLQGEPSPFYNTKLFTELKFLEDNWETIQSELPPFDQSKV